MDYTQIDVDTLEKALYYPDGLCDRVYKKIAPMSRKEVSEIVGVNNSSSVQAFQMSYGYIKKHLEDGKPFDKEAFLTIPKATTVIEYARRLNIK